MWSLRIGQLILIPGKSTTTLLFRDTNGQTGAPSGGNPHSSARNVETDKCADVITIRQRTKILK